MSAPTPRARFNRRLRVILLLGIVAGFLFASQADGTTVGGGSISFHEEVARERTPGETVQVAVAWAFVVGLLVYAAGYAFRCPSCRFNVGPEGLTKVVRFPPAIEKCAKCGCSFDEPYPKG